MDYLEDLLVAVVLDDADADTPIFDEVFADHEAAFDAGYVWHEHWRLQMSFDESDAIAEAEAEHFGLW